MDNFNTILQLPQRCLLNKKITKAFFKRNFELTSKEKTLLDDASVITSMDWLASISPASANINLYSDEDFLYEEVQVIIVNSEATNFEKSYFNITDLIQKYIPYPILLIVQTENHFIINTCDKKINRNDNSLRTIDKRYTTELMNEAALTEQQQSFLNSLSFAALDKTNLKTFYDSYTQRIVGLQTAMIKGSFIPRTQSRTANDMENLERIETLEKEIATLQNQAKKETQLSQRIALNTELQQKRKQIEQLKELIIL
jgi:hypothetical protein